MPGYLCVLEAGREGRNIKDKLANLFFNLQMNGYDGEMPHEHEIMGGTSHLHAQILLPT